MNNIIGIVIIIKFLIKSIEKNFIDISDIDKNIIPEVKILILYFVYPTEFFDFINNKHEIMASKGI